MGRILLVDAEPSSLDRIAADLRADGHTIWVSPNAEHAREILSSGALDAIITQMVLPVGNGLDVVAWARRCDRLLSGVVLTALAADDIHRQTLHLGSLEILERPSHNEIRSVAGRACERTALLRDNLILREAGRQTDPANEILGNDNPCLSGVWTQIGEISSHNAPVLITGEPGTGKTLVGRAIHQLSTRKNRPLAPITAGRLEAFVAGNADVETSTLVNAAHHGTLLVEEVLNLPLTAQSKLLRIMVGGGPHRNAVPFDSRLILTSSVDLAEQVERGLFREDLFRMLNETLVRLLPLRQRVQEIPPLAIWFSTHVSNHLQVSPRSISVAAMNKLRRYRFPGNIRELRNLVQRAYMISASHELDADDFLLTCAGLDADSPDWKAALGANEGLLSRKRAFDLPQLLAHIEKDLIRSTLDASGGAQAEAARRMRISRSLLAYKLNKYGIRQH